MSSTEQGDFWAKAEKPKKSNDVFQHDPNTKPPMSRGKKIVLYTLGSLAFLVVGLVVFLPKILGALAPGLVPAQASKFVNGDVALANASLSWGGPQRIEGFSIGRNGNSWLTCDIEVEGGLLALARGGTNIGTVIVSNGTLNVVRDSKGVVNLSTLNKAPPSQPESTSTESSGLPSGLNIKLIVENLDFNYLDSSGGSGSSVAIKNIDLRVDVVADEPLMLSLKSKSPTTNIKSEIKISNWSDGETLQIGRAKVDGTVEFSNFPSAVIDALLSSGQNRIDVRTALGDVVSLNLLIKGGRDQGSATIDLRSGGINLSGGLALKDDAISSTSELKLDIKGAALRAMLPAVDAALAQSPNVSVDSPPDISLRLTELRIPISKGEIKTLRGAAANIDVSTSELRGGLRVDEVLKPFRLTPTRLVVRSSDLASGIQGSLTTSLGIDGVDGGSISVNYSSGGLLDSKGMIATTLPKDIRADVAVKEFSTAILQPFVATSGLDLTQDIGPTLNVALRASAGSSLPDRVPPTTVSIDVTSKEMSIVSQFTADDRGVEFAPDSTRIEMKSVGRLSSRFVGPRTGWRVDPSVGSATITVSGFVLPSAPEGGYAFHDVRTKGSVSLKNLKASAIAKNELPLDVKDLKLDFSVDAAKVSGELNAAVVFARETMTVASSVEIPELLVASNETNKIGIAPLPILRPSGRISLTKLPIDIVRLLPLAPELGVDREIRLFKTVVGDTLDVSIAARPDQQPGLFGSSVAIKSRKLNCTVTGRFSQSLVSLSEAKLSTQIDAQTVTSVLERWSPEIKGVPTLTGASTINVSLGAFDLPLDSSSRPVWSQAGEAVVSIESGGQTLLEGLRFTSADGIPRDIGRVGFQSLRFSAQLPFHNLFNTGQPDARDLKTEFAATIIGPSKSPIADLRAKARVEIDSSKPVGPLNLEIGLSKLDTKQLEILLPQGAPVFGALGDSADITSTLVITPGKDLNPLNLATATIVATNELKSRGIKTDGPVVLAFSPTTLEIRDGVKIECRLAPAFINQMLSGGDTKNASLALTKPTDLIFTVSSCKLPRHSSSIPNVNCSLFAPELQLTDSIGREILMTDLRFGVSTDDSSETKPVNFSMEVKSAAVNAAATSNPIIVSGRLENVFGEQGVIDPAAGLLSLRAELKSFPTIVADTLADQKGLLVDLLGDACDISASADRVPLKDLRGFDGRQFGFKLSSPRVSTALNGSITDSVFSTSTPLTVSVVEVTNGLTQRFIGAVPVLKKLEKQMVQSPATITERSIRVPIDSDMKKLNGAVIFDPGEVTYQVNPTLASLLKSSAIRTDGIMGNKLQPATVNFTDGVGVLDRYTLPLGEFSVGLEGKVDLVTQKVEMVVWLPASQLADAVTGKVTGLLSAGSTTTSDSGTVMSTLLELVPNWPFKVAGPLSSPASNLTLDSDRVLEEFKKNGGYKKLIEKIGGSKIKDLLKPKDLPKPTLPK